MRKSPLTSCASTARAHSELDGSSRARPAQAAWTKAQFIDYYADVDTCDPSAWYFWDMKAWFVTTSYAVDASAPPGFFEPPSYCKNESSPHAAKAAA